MKHTLLLVQLRPSYGVDRIYPANELAKALVELLRAKTFRETDLKKLGAMGFEIEWLPQGEPEPEGRGEQTNETKENV